MLSSTSALVRRIAEQTDSAHAAHIITAFDCLISSLSCAGYHDFAILDDALGLVIECVCDAIRHIVLVYVLDDSRHDLTIRELDEYVQGLLQEGDDRGELVRETAGALLDVASVRINPVTTHCSVHHLVDALHTQTKRPKDQRFLVPRGSERPIRILDDLYAGRGDNDAQSSDV